jgi:hypothetical protein
MAAIAAALAVAGAVVALGMDRGPPSPEAEAYLARAVAVIRARHINSGHADWPAIEAEAQIAIRGARTSADTYPAIRGVLATLGEDHSFFIPPEPPAPPRDPSGSSAVGAQPLELPSGGLFAPDIAEVRLPELNTVRRDGPERGARYAAVLRDTLIRLDRARLCGLIVDLRGNGGGNMWPMLQGLGPLLGKPPFGAFVSVSGVTTPWLLPPAGPGYSLRHAAMPLAVILGPRTASSGEMVAIALIGRRGVRSFGAPTAGYTTANGVVALSDGAHLAITEAWVRDRHGKDYRAEIHPDVAVDDAQIKARASAWLRENCRR